jgi:hypothetical protein
MANKKILLDIADLDELAINVTKILFKTAHGAGDLTK